MWLLNLCCFMIGIAVLNSALTIQLVLAWSCPVILSCHYYSPKLTHFTLAGALFGMLCATYIGLYCGVWDANMMRAVDMPGDFLFLYTDGVAEATNAEEQLYGTERMVDALNSVGNVTPRELLLAVRADIDRFVGEAEQFDDITMLALQVRG